MPPQITRNLAPGTSGTDVKALQQWLIGQGFSISSATGYYGNETKAAVEQWQRKVGVQAGADYGYFGPKSIQAMGSATGAKTVAPTIDTTKQAPVADTTTKPVVPSPEDKNQQYVNDLKTAGFTDAEITNIPKSDLSSFAFMAAYNTKQAEKGKITTDMTVENYQKALAAAEKDPDIKAKYDDVLKADQTNFIKNIASYKGEVAQTEAERARLFPEQQKQLAEQEAAAGRAYSGFREQAKQRLGTEQTGIIESSKRDIENKLRTTMSTLEQKYGTQKITEMGIPTVGGMTYQPIGGMAGTYGAEREAAKRTLAQQQATLTQPI